MVFMRDLEIQTQILMLAISSASSTGIFSANFEALSETCIS